MVEVRNYISRSNSLADVVIQSVDLTGLASELQAVDVLGTVFLGCQLPDSLLCDVVHRGALVFPRLPHAPFNPYQPQLYSAATLFENFDPTNPCSYCDTLDAQIYRHWSQTGRSSARPISESLARRLHDHAITDALDDFLQQTGQQDRVVAVMGGHAMKRSDANYLLVARIARTLTLDGYLMVSGGGPGAMEATHVGAWFADRSEEELQHAVQHLATAPSYKDYRWLSAAFEIMDRYPPPGDQHISLGIPTWLYGHEPPTPFATHIAKYFANSVREEGLITIASAGIVYSPGSAGTIQEVFQDAAQNHYATTGWACPMVFLDKTAWTQETPVYGLLKHLARNEVYGELLGVFDDHDQVVSFLQTHPPIRVEDKEWSYCTAFCRREADQS